MVCLLIKVEKEMKLNTNYHKKHKDCEEEDIPVPIHINVPIWEKRLFIVVVAGMIGYIATIAGDVKSQIGIIQNNLYNITKIIEKYEIQLTEHSKDLRNQDNRIARIESFNSRGR